LFKKHHATECFSFETALSRLPETEAHLEKILARLNRITPLPQDPTILDVGAAQGLLLICCARRRLHAVGVEPWEQARQVAERLAAREEGEINLLPGAAEALPVPDEQFDIVHAKHVIEHAKDAQAAFHEAYRVLNQGGVFWFSTASSVCPHQHEIARLTLLVTPPLPPSTGSPPGSSGKCFAKQASNGSTTGGT
jgi:2-polyprenyl-3-methyl-5-hydroxy-6-metoxy-1,4-benzoquinol methylase